MAERETFGKSAVTLYVVAAVIGATLWIVTSALSGRKEAWDSPLYWTFAYPVALACAFVLGYWGPRRAWRWALTIMLVQPVAMVVMAGGGGSMLPLGLALFAVLAIPAIVLAQAGAKLNKR